MESAEKSSLYDRLGGVYILHLVLQNPYYAPDCIVKFLTVKSPSVVAGWFCCAAKGNAKTNDTVSVKPKERQDHRIIFHLFGLRIHHKQIPRERSQYRSSTFPSSKLPGRPG
jgi:hypothetical protein